MNKLYFNKNFTALIWMDGPAKKTIESDIWAESREVVKPLRWWDGEMMRDNER
jgi:hypothetical protein